MTTKSGARTEQTVSRRRTQLFAHAEDLAPAYRVLSATLQALEKDPPLRIVPHAREVPSLSTHALLRTASELRFWADLLGSAARRVHAAKYGEREAAGYVAQLARDRQGVGRGREAHHNADVLKRKGPARAS